MTSCTTYKTSFNSIDYSNIFPEPFMGILSPFVVVMSCSLFILTYELKNIRNKFMWYVAPESRVQTSWDTCPAILNELLPLWTWYLIQRTYSLIRSLFSDIKFLLISSWEGTLGWFVSSSFEIVLLVHFCEIPLLFPMHSSVWSLNDPLLQVASIFPWHWSSEPTHNRIMALGLLCS